MTGSDVKAQVMEDLENHGQTAAAFNLAPCTVLTPSEREKVREALAPRGIGFGRKTDEALTLLGDDALDAAEAENEGLKTQKARLEHSLDLAEQRIVAEDALAADRMREARAENERLRAALREISELRWPYEDKSPKMARDALRSPDLSLPERKPGEYGYFEDGEFVTADDYDPDNPVVEGRPLNEDGC